MWNLTDDTNEHIYQAKTDSQTKRTGCGFQGEEGTEEGRTGSLGQQIQAIIQRINKQEGILYIAQGTIFKSCDKPQQKRI